MPQRNTCNTCQHYEGKYGHGSNALVGYCQTGGIDPEKTERYRLTREWNIHRGVCAGETCPRYVAAQVAA